MNFEIVTSVLVALIAFRLLTPVVNRFETWLYGNATHASQQMGGSGGKPKSDQPQG